MSHREPVSTTVRKRFIHRLRAYCRGMQGLSPGLPMGTGMRRALDGLGLGHRPHSGRLLPATTTVVTGMALPPQACAAGRRFLRTLPDKG